MRHLAARVSDWVRLSHLDVRVRRHRYGQCPPILSDQCSFHILGLPGLWTLISHTEQLVIT